MNGFLFDENLPRRVRFTPSAPVSHTDTLGARPTDSAVWEHARAHRLVVVSKDANFSDRILLSAPPPWLVHLRIGNMRRTDFHQFLAQAWPHIEAMLPQHKLVLVYRDRIEGVA